jgi:acyl-coenzyme A synthetase/AMP-(fatty) acid ligase
VTDDWFAPTAGGTSKLPEPFSRPGQICRFSLTSGTTGEPKVIGNTVDYIGRHVFPGIGVLNCHSVLSLPGLTSIWGFMVACAVLASRKTLCLAISPYQAVRMIELFSIDFLLASPDQLVSIVRAVRKMRAHVRSLRTVAVGGSIPTRALLEGAAVHVCKDIRCRYGTSEVGLIAEAAASEVLANPGFVGYVQPGFEVAVFTPNGEMCPPDEVGIVKARAKPTEAGEPDPWTDHGDRGWVTADGRIFIVGRTSEKVDPDAQAAAEISPVHEIEHLLRLEWDASDAAAVVMNNPAAGEDPEVWIGTVDCKDARSEQLQAILRSHGIQARVRLVPIAAVPRGANGKVQRGLLKDTFSEGGRKVY